MRIAFLGLGRMGGPMAVNLLASGDHELVVWNRTSATAEQFAAEHPGSTAAASPARAVREADVVITMLADDDALLDTHLATDGVLAGLDGRPPGVVVIVMGTVSPAAVRTLAARLESAGHELVDAPVSGSVPAATSGTLTIMAAGHDTAVERVRPVLEAMGSTVVRVGASGAGSTMKLALNSILHGLNAGLSEALVLAERAGIDRSAAYDVVAASAVAAPFVHYKRAAFEAPGADPPAFLLALAAKDLRLVLELSEQVGSPMPQARANAAVLAEALAHGWAGHDMSALADHLRGTAALASEAGPDGDRGAR